LNGKQLQVHSPKKGAPAYSHVSREEPITLTAPEPCWTDSHSSLVLTEKCRYKMDVSPVVWLVKKNNVMQAHQPPANHSLPIIVEYISALDMR